MRVAFRIAGRELRGGIRGFAVFLICLALGVGTITAINTLRASIQNGLRQQAETLLGGDVQLQFTYRYASSDERAFMDRIARRVSEIVSFHSMAVTDEAGALTEIRAVDGNWPLYGHVLLRPEMPLAEAFSVTEGKPGAIMDPVLAQRLNLHVGDSFRLGRQEFRLSALLVETPDAATPGLFGPPTVVRADALVGSGLIGPGSLFRTRYGLVLPKSADLVELEIEAKTLFPDRGLQWTDRRNPAPMLDRFIANIGSFLVLVGLAGLAVGGIGISAAIRSWLEGKTAMIATLRTLGADTRVILAAFLLQVLALTGLGILIGLAIGTILPLALSPMIRDSLPFPMEMAVSLPAMTEAVLYGVFAVLIFTLWPLARIEQVRAAALYRGAVEGVRPRARWVILAAVLAGTFTAMAGLLSDLPLLAIMTLAGIALALGILAVAGRGLRHVARLVARGSLIHGRPMLRVALATIGEKGGETVPVILSLGLGLGVLAAIGQINANMRSAVDHELPGQAPAFFFIDIQPDQIDPFLAAMAENPVISQYRSAPMLRGIITQINGRPAREVAGDHWVLRGDHGVSHADVMPPGTRIVAGKWWGRDYNGPPQVSFSDNEAKELGLSLGDDLTVNILGRDITARVTSFREVNFGSGGIGFVMIMNKAALQGAPHTYIATIHAPVGSEAAILKEVTSRWPNITAVPVREAISRLGRALSSIAAATGWATAGVLVTGFAVLVGSGAAGQKRRIYEAAILKTLGATRERIMLGLALRWIILGTAAGVIAALFGSLASWLVVGQVMKMAYRLDPASAITVIAGGVLAVLVAGLLFARRPLAARIAAVLRQ